MQSLSRNGARQCRGFAMCDAVIFRIADFLAVPMMACALVAAGVALVNLIQSF
jgi:hypothetical protein